MTFRKVRVMTTEGINEEGFVVFETSIDPVLILYKEPDIKSAGYIVPLRDIRLVSFSEVKENAKET